jgi:hypothetical protein
LHLRSDDILGGTTPRVAPRALRDKTAL